MRRVVIEERWLVARDSVIIYRTDSEQTARDWLSAHFSRLLKSVHKPADRFPDFTIVDSFRHQPERAQGAGGEAS